MASTHQRHDTHKGVIVVVICVVIIVVVGVGGFILVINGTVGFLNSVFGTDDSVVQTDGGSNAGNVDDPSVQGAGDRASASPSPSASKLDTTVACDDHHYYAGDGDAEAVGPSFSSSGKNGVTQEAASRFVGDTALSSLTDAHLARRYDGIDTQTRSFNRNCDAWQSSVDDTVRLMQQADYTTTTVPEGSWMLTLVHRTSGVPYVACQKQTTKEETAASYVINGTTFLFLPDEGFAPVKASGDFPYVPTASECKDDGSASSSSSSDTASGSGSGSTKAHAGDSEGKGANVGIGTKKKVGAPSGGSSTPRPVQHGSPSKGAGDGSDDGQSAGKPPTP